MGFIYYYVGAQLVSRVYGHIHNCGTYVVDHNGSSQQEFTGHPGQRKNPEPDDILLI